MKSIHDVSEIFITCPNRCQIYLQNELTALGYETIDSTRSGVSTKGTWNDCIRLNFYLRTAAKVLYKVAFFDAANKDEFYAGCKDIAWEDFLDIDKEIKKNKNPKTKLGDIIYLGRHIIICGDSTKLETLRNFPNKIKVSMVYSDPIYNLKGGVSYRGGVGGKKDYGADVEDNRTYEEYYTSKESSKHRYYWC